MSVLFPKVNKPREWDYRPIYFDEEKEARKDKRLARLRRGAFREEHEKNMTELRKKKESTIHSPNESYLLKQLFAGMESIALFYQYY